MKISELLNEVTIDNEHGWGQVPMNLNVEYRGLRVLMKPSVFLKLAAELTGEPSQKVRDHIANQGSIGAPFWKFSYQKIGHSNKKLGQMWMQVLSQLIGRLEWWDMKVVIACWQCNSWKAMTQLKCTCSLEMKLEADT